MQINRARRWVVAGAVLALLAGGCASDTTDEPGPTPGTGTNGETETPTEGPQGEPVELMVLGVIDPPEKDKTHIADGARAAALAINRAGGIQGRPVEIVVCDTKGDPNGEPDCARQAVERQVLAVVGANADGADYTPILEEAGIPTVAPLGKNNAELQSEISFPLIAGLPGVGAMASLLLDMGAERVAVVLPDFEGVEFLQSFLDLAAASRGAELAGMVRVPFNSVDMAPYVEALPDGVDGVAVLLSETDNTRFFQAARQAGLTADMATVTAALPAEALAALGDDGEGLYVVSMFAPPTLDTPGVARFNEEVALLGHDINKNDESINAWAGVHLVAEVAETLSELTSQELLEALRTATFEIEGLIAPIDFSTPVDDFPGLTRIFNDTAIYLVVRGGEFHAVDGTFVKPYSATEN